MNILLVNDDGFDAPGLKLLAKALSYQGRVYVAAPKEGQSAKSHAITIKKRISFEEISPIFGTARTVVVDGTPADSVRIGLRIYNDIDFDLIISGINHGLNLARDVFYSGTVAAAREAKIQGYPAIAVSAENVESISTSNICFNLVDIIFEKAVYKVDSIININIPKKPTGEYKITVLGNRFFHAEYTKANLEDAFDVVYSITDSRQTDDMDTVAVDNGFISITPLSLDQSDRKALKALEKSFEVSK